MAYICTNKAHSNHIIQTPNGTINRYSRFETGVINGHYRKIPTIIADSNGFDGLGFDSAIDSNDDNWYLLNTFDSAGKYVDSIAVGGAMDAAHALQVANSQFDSLGAAYANIVSRQLNNDASCDAGWSIDVLTKLASNPSQDKSFLPMITPAELLEEESRVTFDSVAWNHNEGWELASHGGNDSNLYLDMVRADTRHELVNALDLSAALQSLGAEEESFDALIETNQRLPLLKDRLFNAMARTKIGELAVSNVTQTKPFKRGGVTNVAFVFDLSDGQKVSIWFHSPASTPTKVKPTDTMVSWKWMLNKRDVTAVLSPKQGDNVQLPALATRILRLAAKNSKRFKAAQARKEQVEQELIDAQKLVDDKKQTISDLDTQIDALNKQIDDAMKAPKKVAEAEQNKPAADNEFELNASDLKAYQKGVENHSSSTTDSNLAQIAEAKAVLDAAGTTYLDESEYQARINSGDMAGVSQSKQQERLKSYQDDVMGLRDKTVKPSKIVGTGYKDGRSVAFSWLANRITELKASLNSTPAGFEDSTNLRNYAGYLSRLLKDIDNDEPVNDDARAQTMATINEFAKTHEGFNGFIGDNDEAETAVAGKPAGKEDLDDLFTTRMDGTGAASKRVLKGKKGKAKTPKGTKIDSVYALVDAKFLIASHTASGSQNPKYPQELQPRDRERKESIAWVQKTSKSLDPESLGRTSRVDTGAPIVGDDLVVESGNGRTIAIKMAYANGDAGEYREWLSDNADMFGFSAAQVAKYKQPVLVRIRTSDIDRVDFTVEANQDDKLSFTASERAKSDAKRITDGMLELFNPTDSGDLMAAGNREFIKAFLATLGDTEAAQYTDSNGQPTQALAARMKAAVFSKAYDDDRLLEMVADQTNPELQNTLNALSMAAPSFIEARAVNRSQTQDLAGQVVDGIEQSIDDKVQAAIVDATNMIMTAKANNQDITEFVKQQGLFEQVDDDVAELAVFLASNARSAKKMAEFFKAMASFVEQDNASRQNLDMFGEPEPLSLADVMAYAKKATEVVAEPDLFSQIDEAQTAPTLEPQGAGQNPITQGSQDMSLNERLDEVEAVVNTPDFEPNNALMDELIAINNAAGNDSDIQARIEAIGEKYEKRLAEIAIAALSDLAK